jgi:hypothetical protein
MCGIAMGRCPCRPPKLVEVEIKRGKAFEFLANYPGDAMDMVTKHKMTTFPMFIKAGRKYLQLVGDSAD